MTYWKLMLTIAGGILIANVAWLLLTLLVANATGGIALGLVAFGLLLVGVIWLRNYGAAAPTPPGDDH